MCGPLRAYDKTSWMADGYKKLMSLFQAAYMPMVSNWKRGIRVQMEAVDSISTLQRAWHLTCSRMCIWWCSQQVTDWLDYILGRAPDPPSFMRRDAPPERKRKRKSDTKKQQQQQAAAEAGYEQVRGIKRVGFVVVVVWSIGSSSEKWGLPLLGGKLEVGPMHVFSSIVMVSLVEFRTFCAVLRQEGLTWHFAHRAYSTFHLMGWDGGACGWRGFITSVQMWLPRIVHVMSGKHQHSAA